MKEKPRDLSSSAEFAKWLLVFLCVINFCIGAAIFGLGIWFVLSDMNQVSIVVDRPYFTITAAFICIAGILTMIVSILGFIGAVRRVKILVTVYLVCVSVTLLLLVCAGLFGAIFRHQINEEIRNEMRNNLQKYYGDDIRVTRAWDKTQNDLYCCGTEENGWKEYRDTPWYHSHPGQPGYNKDFVPLSCCRRNQFDEYVNPEKCQKTKEGPPGSTTGVNNEALINQGCYTAIKNRGEIYFDYAMGIGFGVTLDLIFGLVCSIILLRKM